MNYITVNFEETACEVLDGIRMAQDTAKVCEDERQASVRFLVISNLFTEQHCHCHCTPTVQSPTVFFITQNYDRQGRRQPSSRRTQAVTQRYSEQESVKQACNLCKVWHCSGSVNFAVWSTGASVSDRLNAFRLGVKY